MEETVTIPKSLALSLLSQLEEHVKPQLAELTNPTPTVWQDCKTFDDACKIVEPDPELSPLLNYNGTNKDFKAAVALAKLTIVSRAMNKLNNNGELWFPDWSNRDEYKYYPWLEYKAGSGFSDYDYDCVSTVTCVGSRLCFMTSEMARHAAVHFEALYNDLFTL